jgi:hypothetical protein
LASTQSTPLSLHRQKAKKPRTSMKTGHKNNLRDLAARETTRTRYIGRRAANFSVR